MCASTGQGLRCLLRRGVRLRCLEWARLGGTCAGQGLRCLRGIYGACIGQDLEVLALNKTYECLRCARLEVLARGQDFALNLNMSLHCIFMSLSRLIIMIPVLEHRELEAPSKNIFQMSLILVVVYPGASRPWGE